MAEDNGEQNQGALFDTSPVAPVSSAVAAPTANLNIPKTADERVAATIKAVAPTKGEIHALIDQHLPTGPTAWVSEEKLNSILKAVVSAL